MPMQIKCCMYRVFLILFLQMATLLAFSFQKEALGKWFFPNSHGFLICSILLLKLLEALGGVKVIKTSLNIGHLWSIVLCNTTSF